MSLFHNPRDIRVITPRKRKKPVGECEVDEKYACDLCDDEYDSETDLHVHRKSKHKMEVNKMLLDQMVCKTCIKKHDSYDHLIKHIKTHHLLSSEDSEHVAREVFVCDLCHAIYFNKQMLAIHLQFSHDHASKKKASTQCPKCNKTIRVKNAWFHFQRHLTRSIGCCPICLKKCDSQKDLNSHVQEHVCYYRCTFCQYDASNKQYFNTHMQAHKTTDPSMGMIKVEDVAKRCFVPQTNLRRSDFNAGLRGLKLFELQICVLCRAICTEATKTDHILHYHIVHKVTEKKKQYACKCGEVFFNNILLRHHVFKMNDVDHRPSDSVIVPNVQAEASGNTKPEQSVNFVDPIMDVTLLVESASLPYIEMGADATEGIQ